MSKKRHYSNAATNRTSYTARYNSIRIEIWMDICDFQVGFKAGLTGQARIPDCLVSDFCAWHYGYGNGFECFEAQKSSKIVSPHSDNADHG